MQTVELKPDAEYMLEDAYADPDDDGEGGPEDAGEDAWEGAGAPVSSSGRRAGGKFCPGARTSHLPSVCVSATRATLRPHCSRTARILCSSTHPGGMSIARVVRVFVTTMRSVSELEMMSSVAPTVQCEGYTGIAYARMSLYVVGEGVERTREVGGKEVKEDSVCVWVTLSGPIS